MSFTLTVTNAGRAAIVNAAKDGTNAVRIASVGVSATATTPTAATTALPGEIKRITTIAGEAAAADTIHVTVRDETNAQYAVRSIALYLSDGTLFAVYGQSDVLVGKSAQAMLLLALDVRFADINAASITFGNADFLNPPATTETPGVAELATDAETSAGTDDRRTVTPKGLSFALTARLASWGIDIWRAGNDGAGSGLDADLLDGRQGAYYADVIGRLGYTPANAAGQDFGGPISGLTPNISSTGGIRLRGNPNSGLAYFQVTDANMVDEWGVFQFWPGYRARWWGTFEATGEFSRNGARVWDATNDGAGSGLDADLLDGKDGSYYGDVVARLGYAPANKAGQDFDGPISGLTPNFHTTGGIRLRGNPVSNVAYFQVTNADISAEWGVFQFLPDYQARWFGRLEATGGFSRGPAVVWDASNDGSGSGLDADMLDGRHASDFVLRSDAPGGSNEHGFWSRRPDRSIDQWGTVNGPFSEGVVDILFPVQYSNSDSIVVTPTAVNVNGNDRFDITLQRVSRWAGGCRLMVQYTAASTSINQIDAIDWRAVGI